MIPKGLFSQIALVILSVLVVITYVKPELERTKSLQDKISVYKVEQSKVSAVNEKLSSLKTEMNNLSEADNLRLLKYMPNTVDTIAVPRDITFITETTGVLLKNVKSEGVIASGVGEAVDTTVATAPEVHSFSVELEGSYDQIKETLRAFEVNEYPLEVHDLIIAKMEGGFLNATLKLYTYSRQLPTPPSSEEIVI